MKLTLSDGEKGIYKQAVASNNNDHFDRMMRKEKIMQDLNKKKEERERLTQMLMSQRSYH